MRPVVSCRDRIGVDELELTDLHDRSMQTSSGPINLATGFILRPKRSSGDRRHSEVPTRSLHS